MSHEGDIATWLQALHLDLVLYIINKLRLNCDTATFTYFREQRRHRKTTLWAQKVFQKCVQSSQIAPNGWQTTQPPNEASVRISKELSVPTEGI